MQMPNVQFDTMLLTGGMDQMTPILSVPNGFVRDAINYEAAITGGYTRIKGYERFDGRPSPSDSAFGTVFIDSFVNIPVIGNTITGAVTGATAVVVALGPDHVAYTKITGSFNSSEQIAVGASVVGNATPVTSVISSDLAARYEGAAAENYRADIGKVPGSGTVQGGFLYNDIVYAFRANAGGAATDMYKSSASGWVQVPFYNEISFIAGGTGVPADLDTLTEGAVTSTIKRVVLESGSWASGTAAGRLVVTTPSSGNFSSGAATAGSVGITLSGVQTAITMQVGGKIEYDIGNFAGGAATNRVYGADGLNRCFEFDGDTLVPITTGTSPDSPKHIRIHKGYLFVSIDTSLVFSAPELPYDWTALSGAGEIASGYPISGIETMPGDQSTATLMVTSRSVDGIHMLYGNARSNFSYIPFLSGGGAIDYTIKNLAQTYMLDDRGVIGLETTLNFGNFNAAALSYKVNRFIELKKNLATCSSVDRIKSQYRVFFSDGFGLYFTIVNGKLIGIMPTYFPDIPYYIFEGRFSNGNQGVFMCTDSGYLMQMEKGTSFDGANINAQLILNYNSSRSHRVLKRYRKCSLEVFGLSYANISFGYSLGYGKAQISQPANKDYFSDALVSEWDAFTWDAFTWDGTDISPFEIEMRGTAENVSLTFMSGTNYIDSYTINTATLQYTPRRRMR